MRLYYLDSLANVVVNIDEGKNVTDGEVVVLTDRAISLISKMRTSGLQVGALQEIFAGMQLMCGNRVMLAELVDMAHEEIADLLGEDAWRVYGCDDGAWFYPEAEILNKVVA